MDFFERHQHYIKNSVTNAVSNKDAESDKAMTTLGAAIAGMNFLVELLFWVLILRPFYTDVFGSFRWFVLYPTLLMIIVSVLAYVESLLHDLAWKYKTTKFLYLVFDAFLYALFFGGWTYFFKDFSMSWSLIIGAIFVSGLQGELFSLILTFFSTMITYACLITDVFEIGTYRLDEVPLSGNVFFSLWVFVVYAFFIWAFFISRERFVNAVRDANEADKAKSTFLASMSHEIRTPINAIIGMNEMVLREDINETVENYAMNIQSASQNLLGIVNDILDFSKIESGKMDFIDGEYHINSILNDTYNMVSHRAEDKCLELKFRCNPTIPNILFGDSARIRQCIINLLTNGIKYTKQGYVELKIDYDVPERDYINLNISVRDTGVGIKEEDIPFLFEAFNRLDEKANKNIEGTGLGLSITKRMIEGMGGTISVESKEGLGTAFFIRLKQRVIDTTPAGEFNYKNLNKASGMHRYQEKFIAPDALILVVDDVPMNLEVMKGLLKRTKVVVETCLSGEEALIKVQNKKYDIIFMDHLMPNLDGVETLKQMSEIKHVNKTTPVIALTANAIVGAEEEYKRYGFTDYLSKPIRSDKLEDMVMHYLPRELIKTVKFKNNKTQIEPAGSNSLQAVETNDLPQEEQQMNEVSSAELVEKIDFLDTKTGLVYFANSTDLYIETVRLYEKDRFDEQLEKAYASKDWATYQRTAHSIKSTSGMIGATDLFGKAKELELAAKGEDVATIEAKHESVLADYRELLEKIANVLG